MAALPPARLWTTCLAFLGILASGLSRPASAEESTPLAAPVRVQLKDDASDWTSLVFYQEPDIEMSEIPEALLEIEELLQQPTIVPGPLPATLTQLEEEFVTVPGTGEGVAPVSRLTPAAVTRIDHEMIWSSGARRMTELFDIYVPNAQVVRHHFSFEHVTPRGLVSDLEDKYLFLVNGKVMNHQTITGAFSEIRDLPLLGDVHHIDFVRGPGSAMYGPGAISGVVGLVTHSAMTFEGTDATYRQGALDTFSSLELRHGRKFCDDSGLFVYFGMADYHGANYDNAPLYFARSFATPNGLPDVIAGQPAPVPGTFPNDRRSWRGRAKMKLHTQYTEGNFDLWVRYTQGGEQATPTRNDLALPPFGSRSPTEDFSGFDPFSFGYAQFTVFGRYLYEYSDTLNAEFRMSYDTMDFVRLGNNGTVITPHREEEYYGRALVNWKPVDNHAVAGGVELSRNKFGLPTHSFPNEPAVTIVNGTSGIPWYTTAYAFLGEYQWQLNDQWTMFLTGRWDHHTYSKTLFSPRGALIYTPDEVNTLKFIATESSRRLPEDGLYGQFRSSGTFANPESIESLELRYERQPNDSWSWALSGFWQQSDFVGFTALGPSAQSQFADVTTWGAELEASYRTERARLVASHGYTKLLEFELVGPFALPDPFSLSDPFFVQRFSAAPYGFGNDLANYSPHVSKFALHYDHCCHWSSDVSLRVYWGFPGDEDLTNFDNARFAAIGSANRVSDPGFTDAFNANAYLNYALEYRPAPGLTARLDFYNILGWLDRDINKRNFIFQPTTYRSEAAALAATVRWEY